MVRELCLISYCEGAKQFPHCSSEAAAETTKTQENPLMQVVSGTAYIIF